MTTRSNARIDPALVDQACAANILEVARRFGTKLGKSRLDLVGPCPAGCAKRDGFIVSPSKGRSGIFLCRPSGASGNVIEMVRHALNLDFVAAVEFILCKSVSGPIDRLAKTSPAPAQSDDARRIERACAIWNETLEPRSTIVETHLRGRGLELDEGVAGAVLRFHPRCPWRDEATDKTIFVPAMIAAMRSITTDEITGVHRTRLSPDGEKIDRRMLGIAAGAAVKLDADDVVTHGLFIGEGTETVLAARQLGLRPAWALGSAGAIASFPLLGGIEALTILYEYDAGANNRAATECAERWTTDGKEVFIVSPTTGKDINDALKGRA